jgi:hypothetical protein
MFMDDMARLSPSGGPIRDPAGCFTGPFTTTSLKELYLREMRCANPSEPSPAMQFYMSTHVYEAVQRLPKSVASPK